MIVRTCPYDKRDGTICNAPAVRGYDGCRHHSHVLREQRRRELAEYLLLQVQNKLPPRTIHLVAATFGVCPPQQQHSPEQIPTPLPDAEFVRRLALIFPAHSALSTSSRRNTPP